MTDILGQSENYKITSQWGNNTVYYIVLVLWYYTGYIVNYSILVYLLTYFKGVIWFFFSDFSKHLPLTKAKIHAMSKEDSNSLVVVLLILPFPCYKSDYCYCL